MSYVTFGREIMKREIKKKLSPLNTLVAPLFLMTVPEEVKDSLMKCVWKVLTFTKVMVYFVFQHLKAKDLLI